MNLYLREITVINFKGIDKQHIVCNQLTNIYGANRTGKTTVIPDALNWLLTGKDSQDRSQFDIKNTRKPILNRGDHIVEADFIKDGEPLNLRRVFKEVWTTPKGSDTEILSGNTQNYFVNGVPKSATEYQGIINAIIQGNVLKMVTNPLFFPNMPWTDQRNIIIGLVGNIDNDAIFDKIVTPENKGDFIGLINILNQKQTVAEYKKVLSHKINKLKDEHAQIAPRIAENIKQRPIEVNEAEVRAQILVLEQELEAINNSLNDRSAADLQEQQAVNKIRVDINRLQQENNVIENRFITDYQQDVLKNSEAVNTLQNKLNIILSNIDTSNQLLTDAKESHKEASQRKAEKLTEWMNLNESSMQPFDVSNFECPTCKRAYETSDIEAKKAELIKNYNTEKQIRLDTIEQDGIKLQDICSQLLTRIDLEASKLAELTKSKEETEQLLIAAKNNTNLNSTILTVKERIENSVEYSANAASLVTLNEQLNNRPQQQENNSDYRTQKAEKTALLDAEKAKLLTNQRIKQTDDRIIELKAQEKDLSSQIADLQREEFAIQKFVVAKVNHIEDRINSKFQSVKFRLFEKQINGGINESCEVMLDEVPFNMLNTEAKINAGLDILNTLSSHYNVYAPIVIDNRESVSEIIPVQSQVINLFVSPKDKKLRVE